MTRDSLLKPATVAPVLYKTEGQAMSYKKIEGRERQTLIRQIGGCETCGFCEPGLIAWQSTDGSTEQTLSCEECLENIHPSGSPRHAAAYLPELTLAPVAHYVRVAAFFAYATKSYGINGYNDVNGLMPNSFSSPSSWNAPLKYRRKQELIADGRASRLQVEGATQAKESFEFLFHRVDVAKRMYGATNAQGLYNQLGADEFKKSVRVIPLTIPLSRIRSWGTSDSSFMTLGFGDPDDNKDPFDDVLSDLIG